MFRRVQDVSCSRTNFGDSFFWVSVAYGDLICLTDKFIHKRRRKVDCWFIYLESWLPSIACHFKSNARLSRLDDAVAGTQEEVHDEHRDTSPGGVIISLLTVACGD